ncbi:DNA methyltransferase 1-associated protein 1, partial [Lecanoromycetidae sp. Uapishka_2]
MMGSDARDMMGLPSAGPPKPTPAKTPKPKIKGPTGISREVMDLKFEGAPPISIVAPKFKEKPKLPFKPRPWEDTPFGNSARKDGLVLRHWRRKGDMTNIGAGMPVTPADSNAASEMETDDKATTTIPDSYWAKYNVKVERPKYTDEQYETHLKNDDWSKEETDYLVDLAIEFDLRWVLIADRYEYKPSEQPKKEEDSMAITLQSKPRTQEDLKARYYDVAAKAMVLHNPLSSMSSSEFDAHEKMTKFEPTRETQRKQYAEQLMSRTKEERDEEEYLLKELSRIVANQEKLSAERKALYERLETPPGTSRGDYSTAIYQTSAGLTQLMQNLIAQNKNKELEKKEKRRSAMEIGELQNGMDKSQRHSFIGGDKRTSIGENSGRRQLTAREEAKYGVVRPNERITAGVQFRHERITKAAIAKSGVQTTRIGNALTELKIPPRLVMPTTKVVTEYEKLIEKIKELLEVRKATEKIDGEIKIWKAQKEQQEKKDRGEEVKGEEGTQQQVAENEEEDEEKEDNTQNDESKVEEENDEEEENGRDEEKEESDDEVDQDDSDNDDDEDDVDVEGQEKSVADEVRDPQGSEDGDGDDDDDGEQNQDGDVEENLEEEDEDANGEIDDSEASSRASPAPTSKTEGIRKRSASVISHMSNKSSKRQRK